MSMQNHLLDEEKKSFEKQKREHILNRDNFFEGLSFSECQKKGLDFIRLENLSLKECTMLSEELFDNYEVRELMCLLIFYISNNNNIENKTFSTLFLMLKIAKEFWVDEICYWIDIQESLIKEQNLAWESEISEFKDSFYDLLCDTNEWRTLLKEMVETWHISKII